MLLSIYQIHYRHHGELPNVKMIIQQFRDYCFYAFYSSLSNNITCLQSPPSCNLCDLIGHIFQIDNFSRDRFKDFTNDIS